MKGTKMKLKSWLIAAALFCAALLPAADEKAPAYPEDAYKACYELFETIDMKTMHESSMKQMLQIQLRGLPPQFKDIRAIFEDFFKKHMNFDDMRKEYAEIYLKYYTKEDIQGLNNFYKSELGKKFIAKQTELMKDSAKMAQTRVMKHAPELKAKVDVKIKEIQQQMQKQQQNLALPAK